MKLKDIKLPDKFWRRFFMALIGVIICSFSVGFYRLSEFGTDPYQCLAAGISEHVPISFGNTLTIMNCLLLVEVFILSRKYLGVATLMTVFLTGYIVDFSVWALKLLPFAMTMPVRIIYLIIGVVVMCLASSLYITSALGVSAYDAQALMITDKTKFPFRIVRICTDAVCVTGGFLLGATVGAGTLIAALFMGPLIDLFNRKLSIPLLNGELGKKRARG